jgi:FKBP-type peptidyl-prolyl cis-trans isomerase SlyD
MNHPFAGKTLTFEIVIDKVRDATADELSHGHAHGADGEHHHH